MRLLRSPFNRGVTTIPRNSSGVYSLPDGYLATTGQPILASQHNPPLEDLGVAVTGSLPRNGTAGMLAPLTMGGFKVTNMADGVAATDAATKGQLDAVVINVPDASTSVKGVVELATDLEAQSGTDTLRALTASNLQAVTATTTRKGVSELATAAEYRTGTDTGRTLVVDQVWSSAAEVTLTDASTIAVDMSTFINATVTLGANRTLGNPTNAKGGQSGLIRIVQDGTGSRTLAYGANWKFAGTTAPVLTTTAGATDLLFYHVISTSRIFASLSKAVP